MAPITKTTDLQPWGHDMKIEGKIYYNDSIRAWSVIRFRREFLDIYRKLRDKAKGFKYEWFVYAHYPQVKEKLEQAEKEGRMVPVLMWICEDTEEKANI
jgi:radical SAM superfamily enzyme YgiQ (UPF0313 family)